MTIYFNDRKEAIYIDGEAPAGAPTVADDIWHIYSLTKLGTDYDIINGQFVQITSIEMIKAREAAQSEIRILKKNLKDTDYQTIKFAEGQLTEEEFAPIRAQRETWRERIRELEEI